MLSRSAQGLYWMGRYLERGEHLCRLLGVQVESLVDRPVEDIYFGWSRIYGSIGRQPPSGFLQLGGDDYTLADSYTLADDLTFERSNPDSVWSCIAQGRENARQTRHCISAEMWTRLNLAYLRLQRQALVDIWRVAPESFYAETVAEMNTFAGVAESSMYRDEGWSFMQLGRHVERVQFFVSLLLTQLAADLPADSSNGEDVREDSGEDWTSLLRVCHAFEAYSRRYSVDVQPEQVLDLLVTDSRLPVSISRSLDMAEAELASLGVSPEPSAGEAARRLAGRLGALVHYEWPDHPDHRRLLLRLDGYCRDLHHLITVAYFDYSVATAPIR